MSSPEEISGVDLQLPFDQELIIPDADHELLHQAILDAADGILSMPAAKRTWQFRGIPLRQSIFRYHPAAINVGTGYLFGDLSSMSSPNELQETDTANDYQVTLHGHPLSTVATAFYEEGHFDVHLSDSTVPVERPENHDEVTRQIDSQTMFDFLSKVVGGGIWGELSPEATAQPFNIDQSMDGLNTRLYGKRLAREVFVKDEIDAISMVGPTVVWAGLARTQRGKFGENEILELKASAEQQAGKLMFRKTLTYAFRLDDEIDGRDNSARLNFDLVAIDQPTAVPVDELKQLVSQTKATTEGQHFAPSILGALELLPSRSPEELLYR